jgi:hypothetical protein
MLWYFRKANFVILKMSTPVRTKQRAHNKEHFTTSLLRLWSSKFISLFVHTWQKETVSFPLYGSCFQCTCSESPAFTHSYVVVGCSLFIFEVPLANKPIFCLCVQVWTQLIQTNMALTNIRQRNYGCLASYQHILTVKCIPTKNRISEPVTEPGRGVSEKEKPLIFCMSGKRVVKIRHWRISATRLL